MLTVKCPYCNYERGYDRGGRPKYCTRCGRALPAEVSSDAGPPVRRRAGHQPFLDEWLAHWQGRYLPDSDLKGAVSKQARTLFEAYQQSLGRDPANWLDELRGNRPDAGKRYAPAYKPGRKEKQAFVDAYLLLRQGQRELAAECFRDLTQQSPRFADPWIWLAAATDDPAERTDCLETAVLLEPSHPLARDALSIALGRVSPVEEPADRTSQPEIRVINCPQCAGALRYEPGTTQVECQFCGHRFGLKETELLEQQTGLVGELRLKRRFQSATWREVERISRCQSCGAELVMTHYLARQCVFCGSTSVLIEDNRQALIRPDGFLPFKVDKERATTIIRRARPSTWQRHSKSGKERLQGIYLPFWVFDGFVEARRQLVTPQGVVAPSKGAEPIRDLLMFDNLLFCAMDLPFARLLAGLLPYELSKLVPYDAHLLADWTAVLYRRDVEEVAEDAYDAFLEAAIRRTKRSPLEFFKSWNIRRWYQVTTVTYQLVLLPVWAAVLAHKGQRQLTLVNGQTGKAVLGPSAFNKGQ